MRNQLIMWGLFVVPWLTLFFIKKVDIKRFMAVGQLSALVSVIVYELGISFSWWVGMVTAYLCILPMIGLNPVMTMWILKFTYKKFWLFIAIEIVTNLVFVYLFMGWLLTISGITVVYMKGLLFCIVTAVGILLYGYQGWQEKIFILKEQPSGL